MVATKATPFGLRAFRLSGRPRWRRPRAALCPSFAAASQGPARSPAARGPFLARRRGVRSALGHSARSGSGRRRRRHGCGAPRRLGRRRASGAPHPASPPCGCADALGADLHVGPRCSREPMPHDSRAPSGARSRDTRRAFIANLARVGPGGGSTNALGLHPGRLTDQAIGVFAAYASPPPEASSRWGRTPPFRAGRTSSAAASGAQGTVAPRACGSPPR